MWQKSLRETNSEATVTRFEFAWGIRQETKVKESDPRTAENAPNGGSGQLRKLEPGWPAEMGEAASCADGALIPRFCEDRLGLAVPRNPAANILGDPGRRAFAKIMHVLAEAQPESLLL